MTWHRSSLIDLRDGTVLDGLLLSVSPTVQDQAMILNSRAIGTQPPQSQQPSPELATAPAPTGADAIVSDQAERTRARWRRAAAKKRERMAQNSPRASSPGARTVRADSMMVRADFVEGEGGGSDVFPAFQGKNEDTDTKDKTTREDIRADGPRADQTVRADSPKSAHKVNSRNESQAFLTFWKMYPAGPRKVNREGCRRKWIKMRLDDIADVVLGGLADWVASAEWAKDGGQYIPMSLTWLNQRRWESTPRGAASASTDGFTPDDLTGSVTSRRF